MFEICYQEDFEYSKLSQNVYSTFYVKIDGFEFPDKQWTDFPISILKMWCENIISRQENFSLFFMDGPYRIDCQRVNDSLCMKFIDNHVANIPIKDTIISLGDFNYTLSKSIIKLVEAIEMKRFVCVTDLENLKNIVLKLL